MERQGGRVPCIRGRSAHRVPETHFLASNGPLRPLIPQHPLLLQQPHSDRTGTANHQRHTRDDVTLPTHRFLSKATSILLPPMHMLACSGKYSSAILLSVGEDWRLINASARGSEAFCNCTQRAKATGGLPLAGAPKRAKKDVGCPAQRRTQTKISAALRCPPGWTKTSRSAPVMRLLCAALASQSFKQTTETASPSS